MTALETLRSELRDELVGGILPWWMDRAVDGVNGGFVGFVGEDGGVPADAPKGSILNARILWTFAAAYHSVGDDVYRAAAERAADYFRRHFVDAQHGGVYWMVNADGSPKDERKHVYAQSFAIYALAEHHRATGDERSLEDAIALYRLIETHAHDARHRGYQEAFSRDWVLLDDVRLSDEDADERKSMNTHLHVLEAYTTLYRVWPNPVLGDRLREVIGLFLERIVDGETAHLVSFFDEDWTRRSRGVSYGHDIEASWLLQEAADALGDEALRSSVRTMAARVAGAVLDEAFDAEHGGIFYEASPDGAVVTDKEWWPQAEAVVGFLNAYEETGREAFLDAAVQTWAFVKRHVVDGEGGEWHRRVSREGDVRPGHEKAGPWKCCYHNGRACLEGMARIDRLAAPAHAA